MTKVVVAMSMVMEVIGLSPVGFNSIPDR